jgi:hypothetical protein
MNLQLDYEFMHADREKGEAIRKEVHALSGVKLNLDRLTARVTIALT